MIALSYARIAKGKDQALKFEARLKIVRYANENGVKPAAREFGVARNTVRKWLRRWREDNYSKKCLTDLSRAPKTCPHKTPKAIERQIIKARTEAPCLGAERLKEFCNIQAGVGAIGRILKQNKMTRRRKKKYQKKRDMRELKARYKPFEENQIDAKYLTDIPFYVKQMWDNPELPKFEYTWRDVKTGGVFMGFAYELSEAHACCFAAAVAAHLRRVDFDLASYGTVQSDNGSEFSGAERKKKNDRGFTNLIEESIKARHRFIPPGKKNHQADVETFHERVESEFFDLETHGSRNDFFMRASAYQLWWNTTRKNMWKGKRTPDQIMLEDRADRDPRVWMLPALDLDDLLARKTENAVRNKSPTGGYHVPALPASRM